ncbi:MAG: amidohydrolase family protein [Bacteroidales bacterium]|nr:amidohydrolase family protein [Bacteroidales bacterium]
MKKKIYYHVYVSLIIISLTSLTAVQINAQQENWNLAVNSIISASGFSDNDIPENLINANSPLCWTVEGGGFQWIEVRFRYPVTLEAFSLTIGHEYAGEPIDLFGRNSNNEYFLIHHFENETLAGDTAIMYEFPQSYEEIELLRLESPESPLLLCWRDLGLTGYIPGFDPPPDGFELICNSAPDIIYHNANIITMDEALPSAEAMAIKADKIIGVGTNEEMFDLAVPACPTSTINLNGLTVLPGFNDNHNHVFTWPEEICKPTGDTNYPALLDRVQNIAHFGWTSISDMAFGVPQDGSREHVYNALGFDLRGQLPFRLNGYFGSVFDLETFDFLADSGRYAGRQYSGHVRTPGIKLYIDHPLGVDAGSYSQEEVNALVERARDFEWQIAAHAVNTEGIEKILTAYELALGPDNNLNTRYRIEHAVKVSDDQFNRMNNKGIIASFQLLGPPDWPTQQTHIDFISSTNPEWQMRWREFIDSGVPSVGSTDYPFNNAPCNYSPFRVIYEGVTREGYIEREHADWELNQRLTVEQCIKLLTIDGAYATFEEDKKGSITPGKWADFVIVSDDPLSLSDPEELLNIEILQSVVGGITEYCNSTVVPPVCESSDLFSINSALISTSDYLEGNTPDLAYDNDEETYWNASDYPPQWILIDLQQNYHIESIDLVVDMWPEGYTVHQLYAKDDQFSSDFELLQEFAGNTINYQHLTHFLSPSDGPYRFIKVLTTESPSWVAWKEIYIEKSAVSVNQTANENQIKNISDIVVMPAPINESSVLKYSLGVDMTVKAVMASIDGRIIIPLFNEFQLRGEQLFKLDKNIMKLPKGVYMLYLETENGIYIVKVSKVI